MEKWICPHLHSSRRRDVHADCQKLVLNMILLPCQIYRFPLFFFLTLLLLSYSQSLLWQKRFSFWKDLTNPWALKVEFSIIGGDSVKLAEMEAFSVLERRDTWQENCFHEQSKHAFCCIVIQHLSKDLSLFCSSSLTFTVQWQCKVVSGHAYSK